MTKKTPHSQEGTAQEKSQAAADKPGQVVQSFSHGRSKVVTIEIKRKRGQGRLAGKKEQDKNARDDKLTTDEQSARHKAIESARKAPAERPQQPNLKDILTPPPLPPEEPKTEAAPHKPADAAAVEPPLTTKKAPAPARGPAFQKAPSKSSSADADTEDEAHAKKTTFKRTEEKRSNKNFKRFYTEDDTDLQIKTPDTLLKRQKKRAALKTEKVAQTVSIGESISVRDLAMRMSEKLRVVLKTMLKLGIEGNINHTLDASTAELLVLEMGHTPQQTLTDTKRLEQLTDIAPSKEAAFKTKPPVVTIMGHVDHGKTSLLDALRKTNVMAKEAGGITQHIGAYQITTKAGQKITFIDTPGHAAFTEMRSRGACITDVVILLVAADDGVKEQTIEAISHAKASKAPIIVAINKIDKPGANPDRVRQELLSHDIVVESLGGDVLDVAVSAMTGENLDKLQEAILLQAELLELKATDDMPAKGFILEARLDKKRGSMGTVLLQNGTLRKGDIFVSDITSGRVRLMLDDHGKSKDTAFPAEPIELLGFNAPPMAGDSFLVVESEQKAQEILELRKNAAQQQKPLQQPTSSLEELLKGNVQKVSELPLIIKADTQGSLEAVCASLEGIKHPEVAVKIIYRNVGALNESDVNLAQVSGALLVGFGVNASPLLCEHAKKEGVEIKTYDIIYNLITFVKDLLSGLLTPEKKEVILGHADIRQIFVIKKIGHIAGCYVTDGIIKRSALARVKRGKTLLFEGVISTLKRQQNDVKEVKESYECGILLNNFNDFKEGDTIEAYELQNIKRSLDD